ncbi:MAG: tetratricopeptide repeat protein [Thermoguttaceae bacterium]|jgi:tetratricopeptide (TPR) repeat protein
MNSWISRKTSPTRLLLLLFLLFIGAGAKISFAADVESRNLVAEGNIEYRKCNYDKALKKYDEAIKNNKQYLAAHNNRGLTLQKLGRLKEAAKALQTAAKIADAEENSLRAAVALNLGKIHASDKNYDDAQECFERSIALDRRTAAAVYNLAWVLEEKGNYSKAAETCEKIVKMGDSPPGTKLLFGIIQARLGQPQPLAEASFDMDNLPGQWRWLGVFNRCLATGGIDDMSPEAKTNLRRAIQELSAEQYEEAKKTLAVVAEASPKSPVPVWLTAMALTAKGSKDGAKIVMKRAAALMPTFKVAETDKRMVLFVDADKLGAAPVTATFLPGVHLVDVVRFDEQGCSIFNKCGRFKSEQQYTLPAVQFLPSSLPQNFEANVFKRGA